MSNCYFENKRHKKVGDEGSSSTVGSLLTTKVLISLPVYLILVYLVKTKKKTKISNHILKNML